MPCGFFVAKRKGDDILRNIVLAILFIITVPLFSLTLEKALSGVLNAESQKEKSKEIQRLVKLAGSSSGKKDTLIKLLDARDERVSDIAFNALSAIGIKAENELYTALSGHQPVISAKAALIPRKDEKQKSRHSAINVIESMIPD